MTTNDLNFNYQTPISNVTVTNANKTVKLRFGLPKEDKKNTKKVAPLHTT